MTEKPTSLEVDVLTGEQVIRELTTAEVTELQSIADEFAEAESKKEAKVQARESALAKLAALGLTEEEIAAL
jgi:DNA-binding NarL/FixJ family response regulator